MKIPPELHEEILEQAVTGKTLATIKKWLASSHGITVSTMAISKLVKKHRQQRAEVAKAVVHDYVEKTLPADLEAIDQVQRKNVALLREAQAFATNKLTVANVEKVVKLTTVVLRADEQKKKALGVDQPDPVFTGLVDFLGTAFER